MKYEMKGLEGEGLVVDLVTPSHSKKIGVIINGQYLIQLDTMNEVDIFLKGYMWRSSAGNINKHEDRVDLFVDEQGSHYKICPM